MTDEARDQRHSEQTEEEQAPDNLIEARLAVLAAAYPTLVTDESRDVIRSEIGNAIARDARLRRYHLGNGDEPMALFQPYRAVEREGEA